MKLSVKPRSTVLGAEVEEDEMLIDDVDGFSDDIEDLSDSVDEIRDSIDDDTEPHDTILDIHNNIDGHYIAECDKCHEVFISAMVESDTPVDLIHGECPICREETDQHLKWIIRPVTEEYK